MKRKFGAQGGPEDRTTSIYAAPALESTMLIATGGIQTGNDNIGSLSTIPVNASISSGTRLFQYNRFFWNRDLFSSNFNNCAIMLYLSWYKSTEQEVNSMIMPIFLPQTALSTYQSLQSGVTFEPAVKTRLINDMLYYLNGMWAGNTVADAPPWFKSPPGDGALQYGPSFFTYHYKGFLNQPTNHVDFPFFQTAGPPPLKWISIGSNQNIALIKNPDYWFPAEGEPVTDFDCAFQFIDPTEPFTLSSGNPTNIIVQPDGTQVSTLSTGGQIPSVYRNRGNANHKGWCGQGGFNLGFAQEDDRINFGGYTDVYGSFLNPILQDLWTNHTNFVGIEPALLMNGVEWLSFVNDHLLSRYIIIARFLPNFLPSRYITISSDILARDQKMLTISNSPVLQGTGIVGIQFLTLDMVRTWQDATLSGTLPSNMLQGAIGGRTNGNDDTPVLNMDPFYSIQSIDLAITDEWGSAISNFRTKQNSFVLEFNPIYGPPSQELGIFVNGNLICSYISGENSFVLDNGGGFTANVTTFPIPAWLAALNPLNIVSIPPPSQQPLIAPFSTYNASWLYMLYAIANPIPTPGSQFVTLPVEFSPSMPYSGNIIHFGRVLGY